MRLEWHGFKRHVWRLPHIEGDLWFFIRRQAISIQSTYAHSMDLCDGLGLSYENDMKQAEKIKQQYMSEEFYE